MELTIEDWDELRWFLATVRAGSLAAAADRLGVAPTTVSRRMQAFEERLGVKLFDRLRGGAILSPAGDLLWVGAERVEEAVRGLEREAAGEEIGLRGVVRLAIAEPIAHAWALPIASIAARYPQLSLQLVLGDQMHSLTRREADIALRVTASPPDHLVGRALSPVAVAAYASVDAVPDDLRTAPWIGWTGLGEDETTIGRVRQHVGAEGPYVLHVDAYGVMVELGRRGAGLVALPCALGEVDPGFVRVGSPLAVGFPLWLLTHPDLRRTPRIRVWMDALIELVRNQGAAMMGLTTPSREPGGPARTRSTEPGTGFSTG